MDARRRTFLTAFVPGAALAAAGLMNANSALGEVMQDPGREHGQPQQTTTPPNRPVLPPPVPAPTTAQLRQNQRDIRKDVDQLFSLAQELKSLAAKSDASEELSVGLIEKTEEIEKLAKKIRDLARS